MNFNKKSEFEMEKKTRLNIKRKQWALEQQLLKEHEKRKLKMIEMYEKRRAEILKNERRSSQRSKSNSPQRRKTFSMDSEHSEDFKTLKNSKDTIIDEKELHKIKITFSRQSNTKDQITSEKIERDIANLDDIILPRKIGEGSCPIFKKINVAQARKIEKTHREEQSVISKKELPTDIDTRRYSVDDRDLQCDRSLEIEEIESKISSIFFEEKSNLKNQLKEKELPISLLTTWIINTWIKINISCRLTRYQEERQITSNNYKHKRRGRSSSKGGEEKDRNKKRDRSHSSHSSHSYSYSNYRSYTRRRSRSNSSTTSIVKDRSSYRRSKSSSSMGKYVREKRIDNMNQSLSRSLSRSPSRPSFRSSSKNDPDKSQRNDWAKCPIQNLPIFSSPYIVCNRFFLEPSHMLPPPMIWTRPYPAQYPLFTSHMIRWRMPPPRFVNNINRGAHHPR